VIEESSPLRHREILVTRPAGRGDGIARHLAALGARVHLRPTIAFEPPVHLEPARRAIRRIGSYDFVVFTSGTGVRAFATILAEVPQRKERRYRIAAVGPATARALEDAGLGVDLVTPEGRSEDLASLLGAMSPAGRKILVVRPEVGREFLQDALRAAGAEVDAVPFYRTVAAAGARELAADVTRGRFDAVVFTSPSSLERLVASAEDPGALHDALARTRLVAIGRYTASAIEESGLTPQAIAERPTEQGIAKALLHAFAHAPGGDPGAATL
jgi:uroporphyrinogen III methyltransferase/synthase